MGVCSDNFLNSLLRTYQNNMDFRKLNTITGWVVFAIAAFVYLSTIEPTTSFWDTGEYIATAYKLEVGHPPGAPTFLLLARFFSFFVEEDQVAFMVNSMSALCSAFTILFLFWTITILAGKVVFRKGITSGGTIAVLASGVVGALAYTFSDSFWFSAVEGEVYAMSSFFTAIVFWAGLKWEQEPDRVSANRWLVLIFLLIGISIGVHLLNLLTLPALTFIYYYKNYTPTRNGLIITGIASVLILGFVQMGVIPGIVNLAAKFELLFVNVFGLPFNTGTIIYFLLLIGLVTYGLYYSHKKVKPIMNTILLCFTVMVIGYSTFFVIVIRSQANPPIDENNPENAITLLAYLNREQYGEQPLLYGPYYNAPLDATDPYEDGSPLYIKDEEAGKYVIADPRKNEKPNYDPAFMTIFPRMYSPQANHVTGYKIWADVKGKPVRVRGRTETLNRPTFGENLTYFFRYQINYMYVRYFMWNFVGRQNDIQGTTTQPVDGNWISGIPFIDAIFLGDQSELPESMLDNKGRNTYFFLPLILGILGIVWQFKNSKNDGIVILLLFFFTGLAIVVFLNQPPFQPRERDYAFVGSFYAFAIWIGLGVLWLFEKLAKPVKNNATAAMLSGALCLVVPGIMAAENWDDHDRSDRYTARDFAMNYLESCAPNAILFTNGDNDTFPLWYVQEVEGFRTDVRVCNLSLLQTDWYIDQMKKKAYDSEPVPFTLESHQYRQGTRDFLPKYDRGIEGYTNLKEVMAFVASEDPSTKYSFNGKNISYFPTSKVYVEVDKQKVLSNGTVPPEMADQVVDRLEFEVNKNFIIKNDMMVLDLLAANNWERPIYFAITAGEDSYLNLMDYFQLEGLTYRLIPVKNPDMGGHTGRVNTDIMYTNLMEKYRWGGMENPGIYMDENNLRMTMNLRNNFYRLSSALIEENKLEKAKLVLDKAMQVMPKENVPYNYMLLPIAEQYYRLGEHQKANELIREITHIYHDNLEYYATLSNNHATGVARDIEQAMQVLRQSYYQASMNNQEAVMKEIEALFGTVPQGESRLYKEQYNKYFAGS